MGKISGFKTLDLAFHINLVLASCKCAPQACPWKIVVKMILAILTKVSCFRG
ncbi:hypothetical protein BS78_K314400 [Paspalum vaginatum]|uniref:Uncharacterized protein n=1 Tax=Paspalum vaginatum TaxID=158149 RepID=A0A9W7X988_9POAL|nr:hypothetical protein BS78_K314400 [Paspalum vaginatum]